MPRRREEGQASTALLLSFTFVLLLVSLMAIPRLAKAGTERTGLDAAADAAALAGAQRVQEMLPQIVAAHAQSGGADAAVGSVGSDSAISFAQRNGSHVVFYQYTPQDGRVTVTVRSDSVQQNGQQNTARAVADTGFAFGRDCTVDVDPPEPAPAPAPGQPSPPASGHLRCEGVDIEVVVDAEGRVAVRLDPGQLRRLLLQGREASLVR
ncbi:MAG: pilus assembly protein TadG-related protein [Cutibacterium granulosum]|nr:pilus assembly protein TadG-related protein [Cutibacterium granulosum]